MIYDRKIPAREFRVTLELEEATELLPLLQVELGTIEEQLKTEKLDEEARQQLADKYHHFDLICHRIFRAQEKKREADLGREPEFVRAVQEAIENGTL